MIKYRVVEYLDGTFEAQCNSDYDGLEQFGITGEDVWYPINDGSAGVAPTLEDAKILIENYKYTTTVKQIHEVE